MSIPLATSFGPRLAADPVRFTFPSDTAALVALATVLEHKADQHLAEGRGVDADRVAHLACEVRCRATGERA